MRLLAEAHRDGTDEAETVVLDGGSGIGDGGVLERVGLGGVFAEIAGAVALVVGENDRGCLCLEEEGVDEVGILAIDSREGACLGFGGYAPTGEVVLGIAGCIGGGLSRGGGVQR